MSHYRLILVLFVFSFVTQGMYGQSTPAKTSSKSNTANSIKAGEAVYTQYCVSCHQADGGGVMNMNPPLIKTSFVLGDKNVLIGVLLKGMSHQEIDGESYHNVMPPFDYLSDQDIADVLTYVRNSFGNKAKAVSAAEVTKARTAK